MLSGPGRTMECCRQRRSHAEVSEQNLLFFSIFSLMQGIVFFQCGIYLGFSGVRMGGGEQEVFPAF